MNIIVFKTIDEERREIEDNYVICCFKELFFLKLYLATSSFYKLNKYLQINSRGSLKKKKKLKRYSKKYKIKLLLIKKLKRKKWRKFLKIYKKKRRYLFRYLRKITKKEPGAIIVKNFLKNIKIPIKIANLYRLYKKKKRSRG